MSEKMSWVQLRQAVAAKTGMSTKEVAGFMELLTQEIAEGLQRDKQVKIADFGTFKVKTVAARESVNVQSGERFTIEGYNKISFTAISEEGKPNRTPDTNAEPLKKLGEQAEEIKDLLADLQMPEVQSDNETKDDVQGDKGTMDNVQSGPCSLHDLSDVSMGAAPAAQQEKVVVQKAPFRPWLTGFLTILIFCLLLVVAYFFLQHKIDVWLDSIHHQVERPADSTIPTSQTTQTILTSQTSQPGPTSQEIDYSQTKAYETLTNGSRLSWVARKYYGDKDYWVFLYEANKDILSNPNDIKVGTVIRVPELRADLLDLTNPTTRSLVDSLLQVYGK